MEEKVTIFLWVRSFFLKGGLAYEFTNISIISHTKPKSKNLHYVFIFKVIKGG